MTAPDIAGRGGKSGGSGATESRDTLRSTQIAEVMDVISEGECEGLVDGLKSIYLDGVPIQNADGSYNFTGVNAAWQVGTQGQPALPGFDGVKTEFSVGTDVTYATPVVRTITNPDYDKARVTITVPQLSQQDTTNGNLSGSSFGWAIDVQSNGGGFVAVNVQTLYGKTMAEYTRTVEFDLPGSAPWDIRVRRTTPDSTSSAIVNAFSWYSYTAIQSVKLRYPNTGYALTSIDAEQFSSVASRAFHWRGLRVRVPTNYNPVTRAYTGTWDGTFKIAYTNNPAWVFYDMATSERYGLGAFLDESQINKWSLYKIGQYSDGLVPDGKGGMEPRFTINVQIMDRQEAFKLMQLLAEVFRGMAYWTGSTLDTFQDAPEEPSLLYTPANVVDGNFAYQDSSERGMHSVFIAYWTDMTQMGKSVPEVYAPSDLIARYGMRELEIKPLGCTSRAMAARLCRWARYTEQMEGESVTFTVGSDGAVAAPGKIFKIADPSVAGERQGGRIVTATLTQVQLDAPANLAAGEDYTISVLQPAPGSHMGYVVEERTVTNSADPAASVINVTPAFSAVPVTGTVWVLQSAGLEPTLWRCMGVEEQQGKNQYQITGVAHNPSKFDAVELGLVLDEPVVTRLSTDSLPPQSLSLLETVYTDKTINKTSLTMSVVPSSTGKRHKFSYRVDHGWWVDLPETSEQTIDLQGIDAGFYEVSVKSFNALGVSSAAITNSITLVGGKAGIKAVTLKSNAITFKVGAGGSSSPSAITLLANVGSLEEDDLTWTVTSGTATLTGSGPSRTLTFANMGSDTVTVRASIVEGGDTYADTMTISKVYDGEDGAPGDDGAPGPKYAQVSLYQWSPTQPSGPTGQTTYTWATGAQTSYTGANGWQIGVPANPGTAGMKLWQTTVQIAAAGGDTTTIAYWTGASVVAVGQNGAGVQSVEVAIYAWAVNLVSLPALTGSATYTWSTQAVSSVPSGWSSTPGTSPTAGQTLFKASVRLQDATTSATTAINWTSASIAANGYAGSNGDTGQAGASARIAYAKVSGSTIGSGTVTTAGPTSFPATNAWGRGETWSGTVPTIAADESIMQTDGIYDPATGNTVWGSPYLSTWRVGSLSAITANMGSITAGEMNIGGGNFQISTSGYLVAKGIQIQDEFGNVILSTRTGSASSVPSSYVTPASGWLNSNIGVSGGVLTGIGTAGVQVDNSYLAAGANMCPNSDFGAGQSNWGMGNNSFGAQWAVNGLTDPNTWCLNRGQGEGTLVIYQNNNTQTGYAEVVSDPITVAPGDRYVISAYVAVHRCNSMVFAWVLDTSGTIIANIGAGESQGANNQEASGGITLAGYKRVYVAGTIPTGAHTILVAIRKYGTVAGQSDSWLFACRAQAEKVAGNASDPGPWGPTGAGKWTQARIDTAATTATWTGVSGGGKPQDNATVGAQLGTNLKDSGGSVLGDTAVKNSAISLTVNSNGTLSVSGGPAASGAVTIGGLGYSGDLNATYGAVWGSTLSGRPANLAALAGSEAIKNGDISISIGAGGTLSASGGPSVSGAVTLSGLGAGAMATINAITAANASTYISGAIINLANINLASIGTLSALTNYLGTVDIAAGGYLRSDKPSYGHTTAGFFLGWNGGEPAIDIGDANAYLRYKPSSGLLIKLNSFTASLNNSSTASTSGNGTKHLGNVTVTPSGGVSPYTYSWAVFSDADVLPESKTAWRDIASDDDKCDLYARSSAGSSAPDTQYISLVCVVTDVNGRVALGRGTITYYWNGGAP